MTRVPTMLRMPADRPVLEQLEPRLLYSADFTPAALAGIDAADPPEERLLHDQQETAVDQAIAELVFIDESVPDVDWLIVDLEAQRTAGRPLEIIRIADSEDGIARISATLAGRDGISAAHVIGHGSDGVIQLGNAQLTEMTMLTRAAELAGWSGAFSEDADLLLYGCDIAASASGQTLVADLAALTGTDVAASDDATGSLLRGADWVLEVASGPIAAGTAPSLQAQAQWQGELAAGTYYLDGDNSPPFSDLVVARPGGLLLPNFDPGRDMAPGLTIHKDIATPDQSDPTKHHTWATSKGAVTFANEEVTFTFWTDVKNGVGLSLLDMPQGKAGSVTVYLMDMNNGDDTSGTVIASRSISDSTWGDGFSWEQKTVDFGTVNYSIPEGHHLAVKLVVNNASDDDLWFAYGSAGYDSRLQIGPSSNTAPVVGMGGGPLAYSENLPPTVIDPLATVTDSDSPDFAGGALTVDFAANGSADDRLAVRNQGNAPGQIGVSGSTISYGGTTIGSWSGGSDGATPLVVNLNGNATQAAVQALARNVTFQNTSDDPSTAARMLRFAVSDGDGGTSSAANKTVNVSAIDDAPVITSNGGGASALLAVAENSTAVTTVTATDVDTGTGLTYSIAGGADAGRFGINASTGVLRFLAAPDYESPTDVGGNNVYDVTVAVSDGALADTQSLAVNVGNANDNAPVITSNGGGAGAAVSMAENSTVVTSVTAADADAGSTLTYAIAGGADASHFGINASTGALRFLAAPDYEAPSDAGGNNVYDVTVAVSDGALTDTQSLAVSVSNLNDNAPVITANSLTISEGGSATPVISGVDPDDAAAQRIYTVSSLSGGRFELTSAAGVAVSAFTQADLDAGLVRFVSDGGEAAPAYQLTLSDGALASAAQSASVTYTHVNDAPAVVAIDLGSISEDASRLITTAELLAGVVDPDSTAFNIENLTLSSGNGTLDDNGDGTWTFTPAADWSGTASFSFEVTDGSASEANSATVLVGPVNDVPVITSDSGGTGALLSLFENSMTVTTVTATDADTGSALTYSIAGGADASRFGIDASTGVLSFLAPPDHESPTDNGADNVYEVAVAVSDGALTDTQTLAVSVSNLNDNAPVITANSLTIAEGSLATPVISGVDPDDAAQLIYTVSSLSGGRFELTSATGVAVSAFTQADLDAGLVRFVSDGGEAVPAYQLTLSDGTLTSAVRWADVAYIHVNDAPAVVAIDLGSINEDGNRLITSAELLAGVVDPDSSAFNVVNLTLPAGNGTLDDNGNGTWTFTPAADWSGSTSFDFLVSDGGTSVMNSAALLVRPINDAPVISANSLTIAEGGSATPSIVGRDPDNPSEQLSYTVSGLSGGRFELTSAAGVAVSAFSQADVDAGIVHFISDGGEDAPAYQLTLSDGTSTSAAQPAGVTYIPVNDVPVITSDGGGAPATLARVENDPMVTTVQAADEESTGLLYRIAGGADAARFDIDPDTGDLRFIAPPDHEQPADKDLDNRYEVVVSASDGELVARQALTIVVRNEDEAPVILVNALQLSGDEVTLVLRAVDSDTPASALGYSVSEVVGGRFERVDDPGRAIDSFTQADIDAGLVRMVRDGSAVTPRYLLTLTDGKSTVGGAPPEVSLIPGPIATPSPPAVPESPAPAPPTAPSGAPAVQPSPVTAAFDDAPAAPEILLSAPAVSQPVLSDAEPAARTDTAVAPATTPAEDPDTSLALDLERLGAPRPGLAAAMNPDGQAGTRATLSRVDFALPSEDTGLLDTALLAQDALQAALRDRELELQLNRVRDQVAAAASTDRGALASTVLLSSSLSVGYVLWLGRGGALLASVVSALPAWAQLDPLPVLAQAPRREDEPDVDNEAGGSPGADVEHDRVERLFARARQWLGEKGAAGAEGAAGETRGPE